MGKRGHSEEEILRVHDPADAWSTPLPALLETVDVLLPNEVEARRMSGCDDVETAMA